MTSKFHETAYQDWRENAADEYIQAQRRAFLDGFETAANEAEEFSLLREWLREERDKARQQHEETDATVFLTRQMAFKEVLIKLAEIGVPGGSE